MQRQYYSKDLQRQMDKKFRGRETLLGKGDLSVPSSPEREYFRLVNEYMSELKKAILDELPILAIDYEVEMKYRVDGKWELQRKVDNMLNRMGKRMEAIMNDLLLNRLMKIATQSRNISVKRWKTLIRKTLGVDITEDYYKGDIMKDLLRKWVEENVDLIKTVPAENLGRLKATILDGYQKGTSTKVLTKQIMDDYRMSKDHARMIVRDQMAKLNGQITRKEQEDIGVTKYKWRTAGDSRVRDCHKALDGKVFEWANPPEMWHMTKTGIVYEGRFCNPMEDYQCRCVAIPVLEKGKISLPVESQPYNITATVGLIQGGKK